jgi:hypothetical protein
LGLLLTTLWIVSFNFGRILVEEMVVSSLVSLFELTESLIERIGKSALSPHRGNGRRVPRRPESLELLEMMFFFNPMLLNRWRRLMMRMRRLHGTPVLYDLPLYCPTHILGCSHFNSSLTSSHLGYLSLLLVSSECSIEIGLIPHKGILHHRSLLSLHFAQLLFLFCYISALFFIKNYN